MAAAPVRLDAWLVKNGHAISRERARELIESGRVLVDGVPATRPATQVRPDRKITLTGDDFPWVSRGALKLLSVLDPFGVQVAGRICADLGASTGGFTEVLLERGAAKIYAIDVGHNQLAWKLRSEPRVINMEGVNARHLEALPEQVSLIVGDLSFIGLAHILPTVHKLLAPGGEAVILVKPQFEAGRDAIGKGGRVKSEELRQGAIEGVTAAATAGGFTLLGALDSGVHGAKAGNIEHFLYLRRD